MYFFFFLDCENWQFVGGCDCRKEVRKRMLFPYKFAILFYLFVCIYVFLYVFVCVCTSKIEDLFGFLRSLCIFSVKLQFYTIKKKHTKITHIKHTLKHTLKTKSIIGKKWLILLFILFYFLFVCLFACFFFMCVRMCVCVWMCVLWQNLFQTIIFVIDLHLQH